MNIETPKDCSNPSIPFRSCEQALSSSGGLLRLDEDTIHLWGYALRGEPSTLEAFRQWLDAEEHSRASRFVQVEDTHHFILAHGCLRGVLSRYIGRAPGSLLFQRQRTGKPALSLHTTDERLTFNLAHSHGRMLLAVARNGEVGIDLEQVRTGVDVLKLAGRFYSASEHGLINGLPPEEQARQFFRHWVAKEAVLKGQGVGLRSLSECEVVPLDHGQRATTRVAAGSTVQPDWNIQWLSCGEGWEGAVAFRGDCIVRHM